MIPYLLHTSILISILYLAYTVLLSKETFFHANRYILLSGIIIAFVLPSVHVPSYWSIHEEPVLEDASDRPVAISNLSLSESNISQNIVIEDDEDLSIFERGNMVSSTDELCQINTTISTDKAEMESPWYANIDFIPFVFKIYVLGIIFFSLMLLIQFGRLGLLYFTGTKRKEGIFHIVENQRNMAPFSFLSFIFMNKNEYDNDTYYQILEHEKIHAESRHSFDMFLAEMLIILQWFNPFAWMYKNAIENNLEYITDQKMLNRGVNAQNYQLSLVKVAVPDRNITLTNNYNQSSLKKRIIMMNQKKSSLIISWKYMLIVGFMAMSMACLNSVIANVPEPLPFDVLENPSTVPDYPEIKDAMFISELELSSDLEENMDIKSVILDDVSVPENDDDKLTKLSELNVPETEHQKVLLSSVLPVLDYGKFMEVIVLDTTPSKAELSLPAPKSDSQMSSFDHPIPSPAPHAIRAPRPPRAVKAPRPPKPPRAVKSPRAPRAPRAPKAPRAQFNSNYSNFIINSRNGERLDIQSGEWKAKFEGNEVCIAFAKKNNENNWRWSECFSKSEFKNIENVGNQSVRFERAPGAIVLSGKWDGSKGSGTYTFEPSASFKSHIRSKGGKDISDMAMMQLFMADYDKTFINALVENGINLSDDNIGVLTAHGISAEEMSEYVKVMDKVGLDHSDLEALIQFYIHDIDAIYIEKINRLVKGKLDIEDYVTLGIHGVDPEFIAAAEASGLDDLDVDHLVQLFIHGVDHDYIKSLANVGIAHLNTDELVQYSIHGVDADYIAALHRSGFDNLSHEDIIQLSIHGVDAALINELKESGIKGLDMEEAIQFSIHGVDADYIREIRKVDNDIDAEDIIQSYIHGMDIDYVKEMTELNLENMSIEELVEAFIHGIDANDIKQARKSGYKGKSLNSYVDHILHEGRN